jgi:tight adherence protein B
MNSIDLAFILTALSAGLFAWSLMQVMGRAVEPGKKKLQQRLASEIQQVRMEQPARKVWRQVKIEGISGLLAKSSALAEVHRGLEQVWPRITLAKFCAMTAALAAAVFTLIAAYFGSVLVAAAAAVAVGAIPFILLSSRCGKRRQLLDEQLPDALDFLARILRAGHGLSTGLQIIGQELPQPLAGEFRRAYDAHSLGTSLDESLQDAAARIGSKDFGFFVTAVLIQRQTGGDLAEVLDNISSMIRSRLNLQQHVKAKTAEGRLTGYILTAFPILMFFLSYVMNPSYAGVLLHGTGLYLLIAAFVLCAVGLILIRKITLVKV